MHIIPAMRACAQLRRGAWISSDVICFAQGCAPWRFSRHQNDAYATQQPTQPRDARTFCSACDNSGHSPATVPAAAAAAATPSDASPPSPDDIHYMRLALDQAQLAAAAGEVPVGAVLIGDDGAVLAAAHNATEAAADPTAHAEMLCIRQAASKSQGWRLLGSTLYVTLEPCPMCAGAVLQARVGRVVYGARNSLLGADGSWIDMMRAPVEREEESGGSDGGSGGGDGGRSPRRPHPFHPDLEVVDGVLEKACGDVMREFFRERRRATAAAAAAAATAAVGDEV